MSPNYKSFHAAQSGTTEPRQETPNEANQVTHHTAAISHAQSNGTTELPYDQSNTTTTVTLNHNTAKLQLRPTRTQDQTNSANFRSKSEAEEQDDDSNSDDDQKYDSQVTSNEPPPVSEILANRTTDEIPTIDTIVTTNKLATMKLDDEQAIIRSKKRLGFMTRQTKLPTDIVSDKDLRSPKNAKLLNEKNPKQQSDQRGQSHALNLVDYDREIWFKDSPPLMISEIIKSRLSELPLLVKRKLKFWNKKSFQVNQYDPTFKVIYLGNLGMQFWSKDESCLDKPLNTLWNNYLVNVKTEIIMRLTICNSGLKAITRQHGLTQYWSSRLVYCCAHKNYPKILSWIYRHEGKKMRQELRCHAVYCSSPERASKMATLLNQRLACALQEFRREKKSRSNNISIQSNPDSPIASQHSFQRVIPLRRRILTKGSANFRRPLERSKSAPKLTSILEEDHESAFENDDELSAELYSFQFDEEENPCTNETSTNNDNNNNDECDVGT